MCSSVDLCRLKEQKDSEASEHQANLTEYENSNKELSRQLEVALQKQQQTEMELLSIQDSVSELKSSKLKIESQLNQSEKALLQRTDDVKDLQRALDQVSLCLCLCSILTSWLLWLCGLDSTALDIAAPYTCITSVLP